MFYGRAVTLNVPGSQMPHRIDKHHEFRYHSSLTEFLSESPNLEDIAFVHVEPIILKILIRCLLDMEDPGKSAFKPSFPGSSIVQASSGVHAVHLWLLAGRLGLPSLQNEALLCIELLRIFDKMGVDKSLFTIVYRDTEVGSPIRQYLADAMVRDYFLEDVQDVDTYPDEFAKDIVKAMIRLREGPRWSSLEIWRPDQKELEKYFVPMEEYLEKEEEVKVPSKKRK